MHHNSVATPLGSTRVACKFYQNVKLISNLSCDRDAPWLQYKHYVDEMPWKLDPETTDFVQDLLSTEWIQAEAGLTILPLKTAINLDHQIGGANLVTTASIRAVWGQALGQSHHKQRKVAMIGNPGIGKSRSLIYGLRLLLGGPCADGSINLTPKLVVFHSKTNKEAFMFVHPQHERQSDQGNRSYRVFRTTSFKPEDCAALRNPENFYLIDPGDPKECPTNVNAITMVACSPDPANYGEWSKFACLLLYCPLWSLQELLAALPFMDAPGITPDVIRERFYQVGGIPRFIFGLEQQLMTHLLKRTMQIEDFGMIQSVLQGSPLDTLGNRIPTYVFGYNSISTTCRFSKLGTDVKVDYVSQGAKSALFSRHYDLIMNMVTVGKAAAIRGFTFQDFVGWLLTEGGQALDWAGKPLLCQEWQEGFTEHKKERGRPRKSPGQWVNSKPFILSTHVLEGCRTEMQLKEIWAHRLSSDRTFVLKTPDGFTGADYLLSGYSGVDTTISRKHGIAKEYLHVLKEVGVDISKYTHYFLVPDFSFNAFKVTTNLQAVRVCKVSIPTRKLSTNPVSDTEAEEEDEEDTD
jgi:hypothetical protein